MRQGAKPTLSVRAKEDIRNIADFTIHKFGILQSKKYAAGLKLILDDISHKPELGRRYLPTKQKILFRYRYKAHMIFYYPTDTGIFVVRVLGRKVDFLNI